jgi:bifunctional non-homologous end joining protein LigD
MLSRSVRTGPRIQLTHVDDDGAALYHAALATGLEGVVAKRRDSRYIPGMRSPNWLKIKPFKSADFVVLGYTQTSSGLTSLLVGIPDKDGFHYAGRVSSGIGSATARSLLKSLQGAPRAVKAYSRTLTHAQWVEPSVIVEIRYFEMSSRRKLRHPVFVRVRQEIGLENLRGGSDGISDSGRVS